MSAAYLPGWGDEATWGPCNFHPHDPRTPEPADEITRDEAEDRVLACPAVITHELDQASSADDLTDERIEAVIADPASATGPELLSVLMQDWPWSKHRDREMAAVRSALRSWLISTERIADDIKRLRPEGADW